MDIAITTGKMKSIQEVFYRDGNKIMIRYLKKTFWFDLREESFGQVIFRGVSSDPEPLSNFSKANLSEYQLILLNAYVYLHDAFEDGIEKELSFKELDNIKYLVLSIRKILKMYTNYIDQYDDLMKGFKDL